MCLVLQLALNFINEITFLFPQGFYEGNSHHGLKFDFFKRTSFIATLN